MPAVTRGERGYSLTELAVVTAILGLIAAVAVPNLAVTDESKLELAAIEVASAVRFAHSQAIRTGEPHGIYATQSGQRVRAYRLNTSVSPAAVVYDVYDPLTKQLYDLGFGSGTSEVAVASVYFKFQESFFPRSYLGFSAGTGTPKYNDSGTIRMLETAYIRLSYQGEQRTVQISPMTGRVTVQ